MPNAEAASKTAILPVLAPGFGALDKARWMTMKLVGDLTGEQLMARGCPAGNHGMWVLGHIAHTDDAFLQGVGGFARALPESWDGLFGMNSVPSDDAGAYPSRDELLKAMEDRRAALKAWLGSLGEAELAAPIEGDFGGFAATRAELAATVAFHEGFHGGQLSTARRAVGIAPLF